MADIPDEDAGPAEELSGHEDDAELAALVEEVNASLPERRRDILALWVAGEQRPEIAERSRDGRRIHDPCLPGRWSVLREHRI